MISCSLSVWVITRVSRCRSREVRRPADHSAGGRGRVRGLVGPGPVRAPAGLSARAAQLRERDAQRVRPRRVQAGEGELEIEIPQVREAAETFASKLFPRTPKLLRTEPLKALVIGAFVRGLSMRDVESLCEQAGLGRLSRSTASRICEELRDRFERSSAAASTTSSWSRCFSMRRSSRFGPPGRRRACWSPGDSLKPASACCLR